MTMTVTVLTCEAGRTSGYLLEHSGRHVLIDCGPGVSDAVQKHVDLHDLDAVVVTHAHADHSLDLVGLAYALCFPSTGPRQIPLYVPASMSGLIAMLDDHFGVPTLPAMQHPIAQRLQLNPLDLGDDTPLHILEGLTLTVRPAHHAVDSATLRFSDEDSTVAFSSDTGLTDQVTRNAQDADLFICEATYLQATEAELTGHGHLTPAQAAQTAVQAGVGHLLLTHMSRPSDGEQAREAAAGHFGGALSVATRGSRWSTKTGSALI